MKKTLFVMICYARSGGTILNKCLASLENTVMLSEVNPLGGGWGENGSQSYTTVKSQAKNWYQINLKNYGFVDEVLELYEYCSKENKQLILRDWSFVNFSAHEYNNGNPPNTLLTLKSLEQKIEITPFAFVRNGIDVWISRGMPPVDIFFDEYLNYVKEIILNKIPIIKYEDFCIDPSKTIKKICEITGLQYSDVWQKFYQFNNINGDVQLGKLSRSKNDSKIKLLPRKKISKINIDQLEECESFHEANSLLSYPIKYERYV